MKTVEKSVNLNKLMTVKNFAVMEGVTPAYIYKLITNNVMDCFTIDGVQFIQTDVFPTIPPSIKRRNR